MVGFDDGPSISFTSWVIAPTYPRKIVKPTYPRKIVKPHPKILSFNPDGSTFGLQAFWKFREQYTLNAIDMKWSFTSENVNFNVNLLKKYGTIRDWGGLSIIFPQPQPQIVLRPVASSPPSRPSSMPWKPGCCRWHSGYQRGRWVSDWVGRDGFYYGIRWWLYGFSWWFHGGLIWDEPWILSSNTWDWTEI